MDEGCDFGDVFGAEVREEDREAKKAKKHAAIQTWSESHKNSLRGELTKDQKKAIKKKYRDQKRNTKRMAAKQKKKEFLESMTPEDRLQWCLENGKKVLAEKKAAEQRLVEGKATGLNVVIDCGFEQQMNVKELKSLAQQLNYVHIRMKKSQNLFRLGLINYKGAFVDISKDRNIPNWDFADLEPGDIQDYISKRGLNSENVIYLSPDGEEEVQAFEDNKTYIIGGLVDNTVNLNQTKEKAKEHKLKAQRLPLDEFRKINHFRPCLNINTVFEIIDNYKSSKDIQKAIFEALPDRFTEEYLDKPRGKKKRKLAKQEKEKAAGMCEKKSDSESSSGSEEMSDDESSSGEGK